MTDQVIETLLYNAFDQSAHKRHGAISALTYLLFAHSGRFDQIDVTFKKSIFMSSLRINDQKLLRVGPYFQVFEQNYEQKKSQLKLSCFEKFQAELLSLQADIEKKGLLKGKGGEPTRTALCTLLRALMSAKFSFS